jgi:hypothetical protein
MFFFDCAGIEISLATILLPNAGLYLILKSCRANLCHVLVFNGPQSNFFQLFFSHHPGDHCPLVFNGPQSNFFQLFFFTSLGTIARQFLMVPRVTFFNFFFHHQGDHCPPVFNGPQIDFFQHLFLSPPWKPIPTSI